MNFKFYTFLGIFFLLFMSTLGCTFVYFLNKKNTIVDKIIMGLSSGIMLSASIWSLLLPALDNGRNFFNVSIVVIGFLLGGLFLLVLDKIIKKITKPSVDQSSKPRNLFVAMTLHNIPEGLCVGFAFGTALTLMDKNYLISAILLAIGIGIQNFPESIATTLPINQVLNNKNKSFFIGFLSGLVETISCIVGIFLSNSLISFMSLLLAFAAGSMLYVIQSELMSENNSKISTWSFMFGFILMTLCDTLLG
ncbi:MAG: ZIP family metal transporter [Clostridia bacterium]|nr:ZIP family metal transporter [Clostridia bacterium]